MATPVIAVSSVNGLVLAHPHAAFKTGAVARQAEHKADQGLEAIGLTPAKDRSPDPKAALQAWFDACPNAVFSALTFQGVAGAG